MQSANFNHLKLNWQNSLQFQPIVNGTRADIFQQIRDLSVEFDNNNNPTCGQLGFLCDEQKAIYALKGLDADKTKDNDFEGNRTIVYSKDVRGQINISGYINWLRNNGGYGSLSKLSTSNK